MRTRWAEMVSIQEWWAPRQYKTSEYPEVLPMWPLRYPQLPPAISINPRCFHEKSNLLRRFGVCLEVTSPFTKVHIEPEELGSWLRVLYLKHTTNSDHLSLGSGELI